jgi:acylphosphatase
MSGGVESVTTQQSESVQSTGSESKAVNVIIKGKVQGVHYRNWTIANAKKLNLNGWVRNCRDGTVEAVFSGISSAVDDMVQKCHSGPPAARVSGVNISKWDNEVPRGFEQGFTVW